MSRARERLDAYTLELQRHGLESVEREVRWLTELIDTERASRMTHPPTDVTDLHAPAGNPEPAAPAGPPQRRRRPKRAARASEPMTVNTTSMIKRSDP
jgi:hypothetical protein